MPPQHLAPTSDAWRARSRLQALMYHSVSDPGDDEFERRYVLRERDFRIHLKLLRVLRIPVLPIQALLEPGIRSGVVLTFDDAYEDFARTAWPALQKAGYPAALMVPTAHVGGLDDWATSEHRTRNRRLLDWPALRDLYASGVAIESHAMTHSDLRSLPLDQVERELRESREAITAQIGAPGRFLAYPYNRTSPEISRAAERAGYLAAVGGHWGDDSRFNRRRADVSSASPARFLIEILGVRAAARRAKHHWGVVACSCRALYRARVLGSHSL